MGNLEDKLKHNRRRKNRTLRDLHKVFRQKDHSPDEIYNRNAFKKILTKDYDNEDL